MLWASGLVPSNEREPSTRSPPCETRLREPRVAIETSQAPRFHCRPGPFGGLDSTRTRPGADQPEGPSAEATPNPRCRFLRMRFSQAARRSTGTPCTIGSLPGTIPASHGPSNITGNGPGSRETRRTGRGPCGAYATGCVQRRLAWRRLRGSRHPGTTGSTFSMLSALANGINGRDFEPADGPASTGTAS